MIKQLFIAALLSVSICAMAQNVKRPDSYNYTRGVEAIQNSNADEALEYLTKEVKEHPDNGYAYMWISAVKKYKEEYGAALSAVNTSLKKIPSKDKEYRAYAVALRATVYLCLEDTTNALKDYAQAISLQPEQGDYYNRRAQIYYEQGKYDLGYKDYEKMIALDEGDVMGYMGKGRNLNAEKKYDEAIPVFEHVIKLAADYSSGYSFRADSYIGLKQYDKALDDIVKALSIDRDNKAFYEMQTMADSAYTETVAKFKVQKIKEPNEDYWDYCLGVIHEQHGAYSKAIENYKLSLSKEASDVTANRIADCYDEVGDYTHAIEYLDKAIQLDPDDYRYLLTKANVLDHAGRSKDAIVLLDSLLSLKPDYAFGYYRRGWIKENTHDLQGALEDYSVCISLSPKYEYVYINRGKVYKQLGETEKSNADFKKAIELYANGDISDSRAYYAHFYLGESDKAVEVLKATLTNEDKHNCYEAACLYSLMGDVENSLLYLEKSLKFGDRNFDHINRDSDLDNIRHTERFKSLISEYKSKMEDDIKEENDDTQYEEKIVEVPFTKEGGVCKVKCTINGLPLHFIFDTGASDVSISNVEANFMLKNDYLQKNDFGGTQYYQTANGEISEGTVINLRNITFGGLTLDNVKASVVKAQSAPLLLGQSVLGRLGKIEIDNANRVLRITHKEKKN